MEQGNAGVVNTTTTGMSLRSIYNDHFPDSNATMIVEIPRQYSDDSITASLFKSSGYLKDFLKSSVVTSALLAVVSIGSMGSSFFLMTAMINSL